MFNNKRLIQQDMCYAIIKCDDIDKQQLLCGLRRVLMTTVYCHIQIKLVDKDIAFQEGISF